MSRSIENNIRFKVALIYFIVAIVCCGMIVLIYKFRQNIDDQKINIEVHQNELSLIDGLINAVGQAQFEASQYVTTKEEEHLTKFEQDLDLVEQLADSLMKVTKDTSHHRILSEISVLLEEKGRIVIELNKQLSMEDPLIPVHEKLRTYNPRIKRDSLLVTTTVKDTVINAPAKKGFWRRLTGVFSSNNRDTVIGISTQNVDSVKIMKPVAPSIITQVSRVAQQAREDYINRMTTIESHVKNLLVADQEITSTITQLLVTLYSQSVHTRLEEVHKSEKLIKENNDYSIIGGIVALVLILIFILLIINDVNKGFAARKALEKANALSRQVMESRHKLLLSVSHDVKTPLNSILGYLELSSNNQGLSQHDIRSMQNSGKHILALLENLLEFSSLEQGTLQKSLTSFNLQELCVETVEMFIPLAQRKDLKVDYTLDFDKETCIHSDELKVKQIITNLLSNAIKYTQKGKVALNVTYHHNQLDFEVADTGVGIPEERQKNLFKPFFRVEENNSVAEGSGFGMYVVKGLVDLLGGEVYISSVVGRGTRIRVILPAEKTSADKNEFLKRLLIIDDDQSFLVMLRNMLLRLGHEPTTCSTIKEFKSHLKNARNYDAVLTDMEIGTFYGTDILKITRDENIKIPVIVMTAQGDFDKRIATKMGFDSYLAKPVTINSLGRLLGGKETTADYEYGLLQEMFDNDKEAIDEVLEIFVQTTTENISRLEQAISSGNFPKVQAICHKMLSMFMQIGARETVSFLQKMDSLRAEGPDKYPGWENDTKDFINKAKMLVVQIRDRIRKN